MIGMHEHSHVSGEDPMTQVHEIESAILDDLSQAGPCSMDELVRRLPHFTWNQVFSVLDRLSRDGKLHIQSKRRFEYIVSVAGHDTSTGVGFRREQERTIDAR